MTDGLGSRVCELRLCPKCGATGLRVEFNRGKGSHLVSRGATHCEVVGEHLHIECSCGYRWVKDCLDAE